MAQIHFIQPGGERESVEASPGLSVMEAATGAQIRGIVGECGGCCSCATCHVYVEAPWFARLTAPDAMELGMLEGAVEPGPLSRLCCQIKVSAELDGLTVRIPAGEV